MKLTNKRLEKILGYSGLAVGFALIVAGHAEINQDLLDYGLGIYLGSTIYTITRVCK